MGSTIPIFDENDIFNFITSEDKLKFIELHNLKIQTKKVYEFLLSRTVSLNWVKTISRINFCAYRGIWGIDPLDMIGTASAGGRLNVGGAQVCNAYGELCTRISPGLYMSNSQITVLEEMGLPSEAAAPGLVRPSLFEISFTEKKEDFRLFDLDEVIPELDSAFIAGFSLKAMAIASPLSAEWKLQKTPSPIQLISQWLRATKLADGIKFRSTRHPDGINYFFFFGTSHYAKTALKFSLKL